MLYEVTLEFFKFGDFLAQFDVVPDHDLGLINSRGEILDVVWCTYLG